MVEKNILTFQISEKEILLTFINTKTLLGSVVHINLLYYLFYFKD